MPYKFENIPINNEQHDRRVKLTAEQKEQIVQEYETGLISITALSKKYGVSKRLIQFTLFPERKEKNKERFLKAQKEGRYYDRKKHAAYTKKHRDHKKALYQQGLLGEEITNDDRVNS